MILKYKLSLPGDRAVNIRILPTQQSESSTLLQGHAVKLEITAVNIKINVRLSADWSKIRSSKSG